eukprot:scaffold89598_cov66-Phaeocystis_antarctica.AAC.1
MSEEKAAPLPVCPSATVIVGDSWGRQPRPCKVLDLDVVPTCSAANDVLEIEVLHARRELERVRKGGESARG